MVKGVERGISMRKQKRIVLVMLVMILFPMKAFATSWAYPFVVWDGYMYEVIEEEVTTIEKEIGVVTKYSDMKQLEGNFSNAYPKGTKYFSIQGIPTDVAIAIQVDNGQYFKAVREGEYGYQSPKDYTAFLYKALGVIAIFIVIFVLLTSVRKKWGN
ncbi:hypothetical protein [Lysinibacillus cavernae]|uniref:hypothetical protein n=1 Tax=Lysinibacillus cavernae TaxID=2666135 RepID=UPI0012D9DF10|nr:hypothetical protein [Lysinibacillus cavernae]